MSALEAWVTTPTKKVEWEICCVWSTILMAKWEIIGKYYALLGYQWEAKLPLLTGDPSS